MMTLKTTLLKVFRGSIDKLVQDAMEMAIAELNKDIDASSSSAQERRVLKSGIAMLRTRVSLAIRERL